MSAADPLLAEIAELVGLQLGASEVRPGDRLVEELGAESADLLNLVATLEERYGIEIGEQEVAGLSTVESLHALVLRRLADGGEARPPARPGALD